jgi:hypothetical protein
MEDGDTGDCIDSDGSADGAGNDLMHGMHVRGERHRLRDGLVPYWLKDMSHLSLTHSHQASSPKEIIHIRCG